MPAPIRFAFIVHNHQPVGNFDHVYEQAYRDAYLPFLDVFAQYEELKIGLHASGSLLEWLDREHGEYLDRLARLTAAGRVEIIGGPRYEPILSMISSRDRKGQIESYAVWLKQRLGAEIRGAWIPERVWEQNFVGDLADAGVRYTLLDDSHFKNAGLTENQLHGYYMTEDDGKLLAVLPGSEPLRYLIPFASPQEVIDYLARLAETNPGATAVFGDDGEKFGAWPDTRKHVYDDGWLARFFDLLCANRDWIHVATPGEIIEMTPPAGKIYLPEGSYREMTEWVLPADQLAEYVHVRREFEHDPRWPRVARFVRGGYWRNFKAKYSETNEMYCRMMMISKRLESLSSGAAGGELLEQARLALYRGQCNCGYWHGAFGGVYLPHLRNAIYRQLITADNLLDQFEGRLAPWVEAGADDYDLDGRQEIELANNKLLALVAPARGGMLYELDVRSIAHNLLATMTRRPEAYHRKLLAGADGRNDVAGVSSEVKFKQSGLEERLQYDSYPRKSLLDHFYDLDASAWSVARGEAPERGDFLARAYDGRIRRNPGRIQVMLSAQGFAGDVPVGITKGITLEADSSTIEIAYVLEGLSPGRPLRFAVEMNFAGMPAAAHDRYFHGEGKERLGELGTRLDRPEIKELGLVDEWLGIDATLTFSRPAAVWTFPVETVSQSEGGFEAIHQSVAVLPHWIVQGDADGRWAMSMSLTLDSSLAESRHERPPLALAGR